MKYLYENGYHTASIKEVEEFLYKMVPLRFLSEVMGFEVKWYAGQKVIEILK
ncbi:hypothetical protein [Thermoanaerobacterium sp. DL9XJH110]|uniref:hypothetical protein n=1 Tax=Thermoanaerobacterium sp. DL9XJH110 TaxID=3386643 RepID=UPI003BB66C81